VDAAILAASRRAVGAGPRGSRWAVPVSLAAVLVLGIGVVLNIQREQPGIETPAPASEYALPQLKEEVPAAAPPPAAASAPAEADSAAPQPRLSKEQRAPAPKPRATPPAENRADAMALRDAAPARAQEAAPAQAPASPPPVAALRAEAPSAAPQAPAPQAATRAAPPQAAMQAAPPPAAAPEAFRAKRGATDAREERAAPQDPREAELERIARLRADGRHDEADKALETFRRANPQYRIPDAVWERVKPR
jgi:hypothetical protein